MPQPPPPGRRLLLRLRVLDPYPLRDDRSPGRPPCDPVPWQRRLAQALKRLGGLGFVCEGHTEVKEED